MPNPITPQNLGRDLAPDNLVKIVETALRECKDPLQEVVRLGYFIGFAWLVQNNYEVDYLCPQVSVERPGSSYRRNLGTKYRNGGGLGHRD